MRRFRAASLSALRRKGRLRVNVRGVDILLFEIDGIVYATSSVCPHEEVELDRATLDGTILTCWEHGYELCVRTGECFTDPTLTLPTFIVVVEGDDVLVEL
ncbi:Rieske 2Fe-2S domain-containing protein [Candidatus Poribacteria bacterium]|nr:Rieske 2Fe-2S domain-containing protein [Candidatus Poribacteria bacterium]